MATAPFSRIVIRAQTSRAGPFGPALDSGASQQV